MTTVAATNSRAGASLDIARDWMASGRRQAVVALLLYTAITIVYFGLPVLPHLGSRCVCGNAGGDPGAYMWNQAWWPHALLHGENPFFTKALFAPDTLLLGGQAAMSPLAAIAATPITLPFGTVVSYNVWMLVSPPLAAFFAFLLCRYVSGSFIAGLFGGYLFGFSTYMLVQMVGHPNLVFIFMIPAAVHLTLRLIDGRIGQRRFIVLMALALAGLGYTSTEPAVTFLFLGCISLVAAYLLLPALRPRLRTAARPLLASGALAALLASPAIYYALRGNSAVPTQGNGLSASDALAFFVPPPGFVRLGQHYFASLSARFAFSEDGAYIGVPLALIIARYTITRRRLEATRLLAAMLVIVVVFSLGSYLHIAGYPTIPLPWKLFDGTLVGEALPARLTLYTSLIVAIIAALWLGQRSSGRVAMAKWALAALSIAFILPDLSTTFWNAPVTNPPFFSTQQYRSVLRKGETVLIVVPPTTPGAPMFWQAETGMWFRMTQGYLGRKFPPDYVTDPLWPALTGQANPTPDALRSFLIRRHVGAVILGVGAPVPWLGALAEVGLKPRPFGGVVLYQIGPRAISPASQARQERRHSATIIPAPR